MEHKTEDGHQLFRSEQLGFGLGLDDGSFTALLELPPPQAVQLLVKEDFPAAPQIFSSDIALADRASKFSVFASSRNDGYGDISDKRNENDNSIMTDTVKQEPMDSDSNHSSKSGKRKEREKKVKDSSKKSKKLAASESSDAGGEKLPYVHVRARRGQATDSHSLAERARREKINARMKLLQELVPGCNKISGTAMVLDEIINHVQALQRQVEFLSMRLATVSPRIDFNLDALLLSDHGPMMDNSYPGMFASPLWPEGQVNDARQPQQLPLLPYQQHPWNLEGLHHQPTWCSREEDEPNTVTHDAISFESPANSATLHANQLKMEL